MEKLEDLKRQVESLSLKEKQRNKFITEKWCRMREAEAEERRLAAQAEAGSEGWQPSLKNGE